MKRIPIAAAGTGFGSLQGAGTVLLLSPQSFDFRIQKPHRASRDLNAYPTISRFGYPESTDRWEMNRVKSVVEGLRNIALPSVKRPALGPGDESTEELVFWAITYHVYSEIAHIRTLLTGLVALAVLVRQRRLEAQERNRATALLLRVSARTVGITDDRR